MKKAKRLLFKTVSYIISLCVILSSSSLLTSAIEPGVHAEETTNLLNIILGSQTEDGTHFMQMTMKSTTRILENLGKADDAAKLAQSAGLWTNLYNNAMSVIIPVGQTFTFINGSITFLRTIGVIEDPTQTKLESIQRTVDNIRQTVQEIDGKIDDLDDDIANLLTELKYKDRLDKYRDYHNQWTTFYNGCISRMNNLKTSYSNSLISLLINYCENFQSGTKPGLRSLYNNKGSQIYSSHNLGGAGSVLPECPGAAGDMTPVSYSVTVPDGYINIDRDITVNAENYLTVLRDAVKKAVINSANDENLSAKDGFYDEWKLLSDSEKNALAETMAEDLVDALMYECVYTVSNNSDFISNLETAFTDYCNYLCENDSLISPFVSQLQMLAFTHGFEGEIKDEAAYMYSYFNNLTLEYGLFATMVLSLAQIKTTAERTNYRDMWQNSLEHIYSDLDNFITGNNNYCYILGCPLEYRNIEFDSQVSFTCHYPVTDKDDPESQHYSFTYEENASVSKDWTLIDKSKVYDKNNTELVNRYQNELKRNMISSDEISLIYRVFQCEKNGENFIDYLIKNNVALPKSAQSTEYPYGLNPKLVTSGYSSSELNLGSGFTLTNVKKCYDGCEYYFNEKTPVVLEGDLPGDDDCYVIHDKLTGNMFDLSSGKLSSNATITTRAFYGENNWYWRYDEIWGLSTGKMDISHTSHIIKNEDNYFGERSYYIDYSDSFSAIVKTQTGTYTVPADIESLGDNVFGGGMISDSMTFNGKPKSISEKAFANVGTEEKRCFINVPSSWSDFTLGETFYGGYFGNARITADANNGKNMQKTVTVYKGMPCMNVPYPFGEKAVPEHKYFDGWSRYPNGVVLKNPNVTVTDGMTLYAVWEYDHDFVPCDTVQPTCTSDGLTGGTVCSVCGETGKIGRVLPRLGHNYELNTVTGESVCTRCHKTCIMQTDVFGDFVVTGEDIYNTVSFNGSVLSVISDTPVTIANKYREYPTRNTIHVGDGINADITLAGINIETFQSTRPPVYIEDYSGSDVCITLADGTSNILKGDKNHAALQARGLEGTLKIYGNGSLTATGGENGAGIGGGNMTTVKDITVLGGNITATAGRYAAGIGSGNNGFIKNIQITGGVVTASSEDAQSLGNGCSDGKSGKGISCSLVISKNASVKLSDADEIETPITDENNRFVFLNKIKNPGGNPIYIDDDIFPFTEHNGEKAVYVYLDNDSHNIKTTHARELLKSKGSAVVDYENGYLYGVGQGVSDLSAYVAPADGYTMSVLPSSQRCGTNTVISIMFEDETAGKFTVVVSGDANGDSICDVLDVSLCENALNGFTSLNGAYFKAVDTDGSNSIDITDYSATVNTALC